MHDESSPSCTVTPRWINVYQVCKDIVATSSIVNLDMLYFLPAQRYTSNQLLVLVQNLDVYYSVH